MDKNSRIYVAGHTGLVGTAIVNKLRENNYDNLILRNSKTVDLTSEIEAKWLLKDTKPEYIFIACGLVGGIHANNEYPVDFLLNNTLMNFNILKHAQLIGVKKVMALASSCVYPKICNQPIKEEYLLSGYLESTNEGYALAKIATVKLCQAYNRQFDTNFISVFPCSLFGDNDNFHPTNSHLIPAIIRKIHVAKLNGYKEVEIWGTGNPRREFLHTDDLADGLLFLMQNYNDSDIINIGSGIDYTIAEISELIKTMIGFNGELVYNKEYPDGTMKKMLDSSKINKLGWKPKLDFKEGLVKAYDWYLNNYEKLNGDKNV